MKTLLIGLAIASIALSAKGELVEFRAWLATQRQRPCVCDPIAASGVTTEADVRVLTTGNQAEVIDLLVRLQPRAYNLLIQLLQHEELAVENQEKIVTALSAGRGHAMSDMFTLERIRNPTNRMIFGAARRASFQEHFKDRPVEFSLFEKYRIGAGVDPLSAANIVELTRWLTAPEETDQKTTDAIKTAIKRQATGAAVRDLLDAGAPLTREDGSSSVDIRLRPVVDALNAPDYAGLEAALTAVGLPVPPPGRDR